MVFLLKNYDYSLLIILTILFYSYIPFGNTYVHPKPSFVLIMRDIADVFTKGIQ